MTCYCQKTDRQISTKFIPHLCKSNIYTWEKSQTNTMFQFLHSGNFVKMALNNFKLHKFKNKTQSLLCLVLLNKNICTFGIKFEKKLFCQKLVKTFVKFEKNFLLQNMVFYTFWRKLNKIVVGEKTLFFFYKISLSHYQG